MRQTQKRSAFSSATRQIWRSPKMKSRCIGRVGRSSSGVRPCRSLALPFSRSVAMKLKLDANFYDLLSAFRGCNLRYLIVGGWAVSIHAQPRATQDINIFVDSESGNIEAVYEALKSFGAPLDSINKEQFLEPGTFFRIG